MRHTTPELSLIVPCFQEAHRMKSCVQGIRRALGAWNRSAEVLLVDDGSTDGTAACARNALETMASARVIERPHAGKGAALRAGVGASKGAQVFFADADWSMPPEQIVRFLPPVSSSSGLRIGSRELPSSQRFDEPLYRHLVGRVFNHLVRSALTPGIQDTQCGFKAMEGNAARRIFETLDCDGWAFDVELILKAKRQGLSVTEVPIDWTYDSDSRLNILRDAPRMALDVWRIRRSIH